MKKYFILNFLSFESTNLLSLFLPLKNICAIHGSYSLNSLKTSRVHAGYPISYTYKNLYALIENSKFILIKEDPDTILKHLMYGYYNNLYNDMILKDFKKYFNVELNNLDREKLYIEIEKYYFEVQNIVVEDLFVIDLQKHESSFLNFVKSEDFMLFAEYINDDFPACSSVTKAASYHQTVYNNRSFYLKDYFIKSVFYALPEIYPMNSFMNNIHNKALSPAGGDTTYLDKFLNELNNKEKIIDLAF